MYSTPKMCLRDKWRLEYANKRLYDMGMHGFTDIDECAVTNGGCEYTCANTDGSFTCGCLDGFTLSDNELSCIGMFISTITLVQFHNEDCLKIRNVGFTLSSVFIVLSGNRYKI